MPASNSTAASPTSAHSLTPVRGSVEEDVLEELEDDELGDVVVDVRATGGTFVALGPVAVGVVVVLVDAVDALCVPASGSEYWLSPAL
jgi:hypothetical protein